MKLDSLSLPGILKVSDKVRSVVVFAHGSGSSMFSQRNSFVAQVLQDAGLGTFLFDLLTSQEDVIYENRFNINLLAHRLILATKWLIKTPEGAGRKIGYFGASTGAAAALQASVEKDLSISAIVSRGGRPDLAELYLSKVTAPTLLIVGEYDDYVLELNRLAYAQIRGEKKLAVVPKATHLFEEPGALEEVAGLARDWFVSYLA